MGRFQVVEAREGVKVCGYVMFMGMKFFGALVLLILFSGSCVYCFASLLCDYTLCYSSLHFFSLFHLSFHLHMFRISIFVSVLCVKKKSAFHHHFTLHFISVHFFVLQYCLVSHFSYILYFLFHCFTKEYA